MYDWNGSHGTAGKVTSWVAGLRPLMLGSLMPFYFIPARAKTYGPTPVRAWRLLRSGVFLDEIRLE